MSERLSSDATSHEPLTFDELEEAMAAATVYDAKGQRTWCANPRWAMRLIAMAQRSIVPSAVQALERCGQCGGLHLPGAPCVVGDDDRVVASSIAASDATEMAERINAMLDDVREGRWWLLDGKLRELRDIPNRIRMQSATRSITADQLEAIRDQCEEGLTFSPEHNCPATYALSAIWAELFAEEAASDRQGDQK